MKQPKNKPQIVDPNETSSLYVPPKESIVISATFHQAVMTALNTPETNYYRVSNKKERSVEMVMGTHGLICSQAGQTWMVPWANVVRVGLDG